MHFKLPFYPTFPMQSMCLGSRCLFPSPHWRLASHWVPGKYVWEAHLLCFPGSSYFSGSYAMKFTIVGGKSYMEVLQSSTDARKMLPLSMCGILWACQKWSRVKTEKGCLIKGPIEKLKWNASLKYVKRENKICRDVWGFYL